MHLKHLVTTKLIDDTAVLVIRWIQNTLHPTTSYPLQQHSWTVEQVKFFLFLATKRCGLYINECKLETFYQDRDKFISISNDGQNEGYVLTEQFSYTAKNLEQTPVLSVQMQKRQKLEKYSIVAPNTKISERSYRNKRYHLQVYLTNEMVFHITIPYKPTEPSNTTCQVWLEIVGKLLHEDTNLELINLWINRIHHWLRINS